jgi:hypothetical protein
LVREGGASLNLYEARTPAIGEAVAAKLRAVQRTEGLPSVELTIYAGPHSNKGSKVRTIFISGSERRGA